MKIFGIVGVVFLLFGNVGCDEKDSQKAVDGVKVICRKDGDTAEVQKRDGIVDIVISSDSGIGEAEIGIPENLKSAELRFLFQYADGKPFHRLESFRGKNEHIRFQTFLGHQDSIRVKKSGMDTVEYKAYVPIRKTGEGISVGIPQTLMADISDSIFVYWVDMYR